MVAAVVRIGETFTSQDSDFLRLKNDIANAFQAQMDLRLASAIYHVTYIFQSANNFSARCTAKYWYSNSL